LAGLPGMSGTLKLHVPGRDTANGRRHITLNDTLAIGSANVQSDLAT
jgi:hypothetical protein